MHVRVLFAGLREEADEEADQLAVVALGDEARAFEVEEEELRQHRRHVAAAPPDVHARDHAPVVRGLGVSDPHSPAGQWSTVSCCIGKSFGLPVASRPPTEKAAAATRQSAWARVVPARA